MSRNMFDKLVGYFSPTRALARDQARYRSDMLTAKDGYDAAGKGRRNTWVRGSDSSVNVETRGSLVALRGRSREMVRNNPYAARAIEARVSNAIGAGIVPAAKCDNQKRQDNANKLMREWLKTCDVDGVHNLYGLQALAMAAVSESGEAVVIKQTVNDRSLAVPLKIKLVEGDHIDHTKDGGLTDGSNVIQGVQFSSGGAKSGLWLYKNHPGERGATTLTSKLTPIDQVAHIFEAKRPGQVRGIPAGASAFMKMKGLDDFQDARIEQQKISACLVGIITDSENPNSRGDVLPDRLEPGMFPQISGGKDVKFNSPPSVSGHAEFVSTELHAVAMSYGITYEALTGDLGGVNFSSGKMGWIEFSRNIQRWRWNMIIPQLCHKVGDWFIEAATLAGHDMKGVTFEWTPPRREMIDANKEIPAQLKAIRGGLKSWSETVRENGYQPEALIKEMVEDNKRFDDNGIILDSDSRKTTSAGNLQIEDNYEDDENENKPE